MGISQKKPPDQVRRRNTKLVSMLPPEGREGPIPDWPLETQLPGEKERWALVWAMPQAVIWEAWHLEVEVAQWVRVMVRSEKPGAPITLLGEARRFAAEMGATPVGAARLQWILGDTVPRRDPEAERETYLRAVGADE